MAGWPAQVSMPGWFAAGTFHPVPRPLRMMKIAQVTKLVRAEQVSSWMEELGCGALFSRDEENDDEYLLIQRDFIEPYDERPYIETDDPSFCGHVRQTAAAISRNRLRISYASKTVEATFVVSDERFHEVVEVLRVLIPSIEEL